MASPWDALPGVVLDKGKGPGTGTTFLRVAVERILGLTVLLVVGATVFNTTISLGIGEAIRHNCDVADHHRPRRGPEEC